MFCDVVTGNYAESNFTQPPDASESTTRLYTEI